MTCDLEHKEFQKSCAFCRLTKLESKTELIVSSKEYADSFKECPRNENVSTMQGLIARIYNLEAANKYSSEKISELKTKLAQVARWVKDPYMTYYDIHDDYTKRKVSFWQRFKIWWVNRKELKKLQKAQRKFLQLETPKQSRCFACSNSGYEDCGSLGEMPCTHCSNDYF